MQGRASRQGEEEEEGNLESEPVHQASSQRAERQLAQNLQSGQETVVGGLRGERREGSEKERQGEGERKVSGEKWRGEEGEWEIKGRCVHECGNNDRAETEEMTTSSPSRRP